MNTSNTVLVSLVSLLAFSGCRSSDPLAGTWSNETCYGSTSTPEDIESCEVALTFTDGLEMSLRAEWVSLPATANFPGCITTQEVTGKDWSTRPESDFDVLTVKGHGTATMERRGCVRPEDDLDETETSQIKLPSGEINYQITDGVLTILTTELEGTYNP